MSSSRIAATACLLLASSVACSSESPVARQNIGTTDSELNPGSVRYEGPIAAGEPEISRYENPPRYRAFGFDANPGETLTVDVGSNDGDAIAWITTPAYAVLAENDDATPHTWDARVVYKVPSDERARSYRIVFREYALREARFTVSLAVKPAVRCSYYGKTYHEGDEFKSIDSCNDCACTEAGVKCGARVCPCNPDKEPHRNYVGTPRTCDTIRYECPVGSFSFLNDCGCGCELNP